MNSLCLVVVVLGLMATTAQAYNYKKAVKLSLYFYEAQRSGKLPGNNRISWRKDSALNDGRDNGVDLSGGYYDAGDHVKFNFPLAYSMTVLAWGGIKSGGCYNKSGQMNSLLEALKWGANYLVKCHTKKEEFYVQVGDGDADHAFWGRARDMRMSRPSFKIDSRNPGSDAAGEAAAALAAISILFKNRDRAYSKHLLRHAKELFDLGNKYHGKYSDSVWAAQKFYSSAHFKDELAWGAAWLFKATNSNLYRTVAEQRFREEYFHNFAFGWDYKLPGAAVLLAEITNKQEYKDKLRSYCNHFRNGQQKSPKGQVFYTGWGSNRFACNAALICRYAGGMGIDGDANWAAAKRQLDYMLGSTGRSFVIGFGNNFPKQPHHRGASCPLQGSCLQPDDNRPSPNILKGALVGGPNNANDNYNDRRNDYISNEVALDYNAGFQSLAAAYC